MNVPGMDGVYPALLVPVKEPEEGHRYPGVHEDRIEQPVEPDLLRHLDLQEHDEGQDVLEHRHRRPELRRQQLVVIQDDREARMENIDVRHDRVERGQQQEVVLQELHDPVQNADAVAADAFLQQLRDIPLRAVELSLCPALALTPGRHESDRLFIIDDSIVHPAGADAVGEALHGKFHILGEAFAAPAVFLDHVRGDAHARAAESRGKADVVFAQMPQVIDRPESNGKGAGHPGVRRILGGQIALQHLLAPEETAVHLQQEIQMDQIVRVENAEGIVAPVQREDLREHPVHGVALAHKLLVEPLKDVRPVFPGDVCRAVRAVIRDDVDIVELFRVFQDLQIIQKLSQHHFLIMGRDDHGKLVFRSEDLLLLRMPRPKNGQHNVIRREENDDPLHREHNDIQ